MLSRASLMRVVRVTVFGARVVAIWMMGLVPRSYVRSRMDADERSSGVLLDWWPSSDSLLGSGGASGSATKLQVLLRLERVLADARP